MILALHSGQMLLILIKANIQLKKKECAHKSPLIFSFFLCWHIEKISSSINKKIILIYIIIRLPQKEPRLSNLLVAKQVR